MIDELYDGVYTLVIEDESVFDFTNELALYRYIKDVVYQWTDDYYYDQVQYGYMTQDEADADQEEMIWKIVADILAGKRS